MGPLPGHGASGEEEKFYKEKRWYLAHVPRAHVVVAATAVLAAALQRRAGEHGTGAA